MFQRSDPQFWHGKTTISRIRSGKLPQNLFKRISLEDDTDYSGFHCVLGYWRITFPVRSTSSSDCTPSVFSVGTELQAEHSQPLSNPRRGDQTYNCEI
jgi:hypothetical protein